jgi:RNA polymerase sigma-70 factor (ECF subfamily)
MEYKAKQIIEKVLQGDIEAFSEIIDIFQGELWGMVSYYIRNRTATEEILQRSFTKAYFGLESFDMDREFGPWLKAVARNEIKLELRKRVNEKKKVDAYLELKEAETALDELEDDAGRITFTQYLKECMKRIPEHLSSLMKSRYEMQLSIAEIAKQTKRSIDAVKKALSRTRVSLRECIQKMGTSDV